MSFKFVETNYDYIKNHLPQYLEKNTRYFAIVKNKNYVGICGFVEKCDSIVEAFITLFPEFYFKVLTKDFLISLINLPFDIGYAESWVSTKNKGLIRIFKKFQNYGIKLQEFPPIWSNADIDLTWFMKRI